MKKLLAIVILGLIWNVNVFSNELINKQLECPNTADNSLSKQFYIFISEKRVNNLFILKKDLKVHTHNLDYKAYPKKIEIH